MSATRPLALHRGDRPGQNYGEDENQFDHDDRITCGYGDFGDGNSRLAPSGDGAATGFVRYAGRIIMRGKTQGQREDRRMKKSLTHIRTSHVGRLPAPKGWEDMPARLANAELTDPEAIAAEVTPRLRKR
jgi:hypothetical protein